MDQQAATSRERAHRVLALVGLCLVLLVGVAVPGGPGSPEAAGQGLPRFTPTPTPRVIDVPRKDATPRPTTAAGRPTATPLPAVRRGTPTAAATLPPAPTATSTPTATPAPTATATATPSPTPVPTPVATATPPPTPMPTAVPVPAARLVFAAENWIGGYYRGDAQAYGRPWVALYGAQSAYPRAVLAFVLDGVPAGPATLTLVGLDDEWAAANEIALEVNGQRVYAGPSPFPNWDGVGAGENAAWTAVAFDLPTGLLRAGPNEIAVANLTPAANFGIPPYVLLADAALDLPAGTAVGGAAGGSAAGQSAAPAAPAVTATFAAEDWAGGYYRGDALAYGRPWVAVYGAQSTYPRAILAFDLSAAPRGPATLTITGLDDEWAGTNPIALEINGQRVFVGPAPFASWDGVGAGENAAWTAATFDLPAGLLRAGRNEVAVANLAPAANFGVPPYVLLADATLTVGGAEAGAERPDRPRRQRAAREERGDRANRGDRGEGNAGDD